jgi:hypothetical protein
MQLWMNVIAVLLLLGATLRYWFRLSEPFKDEPGWTPKRPLKVRWWWPLRLSNALIFLGTSLYIRGCFLEPPLGSHLSVMLCSLLMALGFFIGAKGE